MEYNSFCIKTQFLEHAKQPENVKVYKKEIKKAT